MYLTQGLRRAAQIHPQEQSTVFGDRRRIWSETADRVARVAGGLKEAGVEPGDRVAVLALNSDRYFELMYAIPWLGAAMVPVNTRLATPEVRYILEDSGARVLFIDDAMKAHASALAGQMPTVEAVFYLDDDAPPGGTRPYEDLAAAPAIADAGAGGETLAGLFYTGGTTGKSKGVMLSHNNLVWNAMNAVNGFYHDQDTTYIHAGAMFHLADGGQTFGVTACGGRHVFVPRFDAADCLQTMEQEKVTHAVYVPTMLNMLVSHPAAGDVDLSSLKYIVYAASPMPEGVLRKALQVFPNCQFIHAYGMTEPPRSAARHDRRSRGQGADDHAGLLGQAPGDGGRAAGRLVLQRRCRLHGRRRLRRHRRSAQGHDHFRRRERLPDRGRERDLPDARGRRGGRDRHPRRQVGRERPRRDHAAYRRQLHGRGRDRALPHADRRL